MQATGTEQEQAAYSGSQRLANVLACDAAIGKVGADLRHYSLQRASDGRIRRGFGRSGHITGQTDTMPLRVEKLYNEYNAPAAFAVASLLALLALITWASRPSWNGTRPAILPKRKRQPKKRKAVQTELSQSREH